MPRRIARDDDEMPRRRRSARAVTVEPEAERGLAMRILLHSPKDTIAGALAFAAVSAIIANALFLQAGRHPSPMFGSVVTLPAPGVAVASPLPRPRPLEAEPKLAEAKAVEKPADLKAADPLTSLVKTTGAPSAAPAGVLRPSAPIPVARNDIAAAPHRVAAVQRALTEYGYGQLKPSGAVGADTQAAIQRFERERRLPVTGQVSDRLLRELAAVIGHPID